MLPHPESHFLDTPTLFIEARFRGRVVAARLLTAPTSRAFSIGAARRADAPVDPAFLPSDTPANDNHALVTPVRGGFIVNLSPAMRARLEPSTYGLQVPCGEVVFDIRAAALPVRLPRLARQWRADHSITVGVAAGLLLVVAMLNAVPADRRALSLDDVGRSVRLDDFLVVPKTVASLAPQRPTVSATSARVVGASARTRAVALASRGATVARDAASAADAVRRSPLLAILGGPRSAALASIFAEGGALGERADETLAQLVGTSLERAYANSSLDGLGTGARGAGTGERTLGGGAIGGIGDRQGGAHEYGRDVGLLRALPKRSQIVPTFNEGQPSVRGGLDKEVVRRIVRLHLNEVRFCYSEALARKPTLAGRVVVQFTIASTGRVIVAALQSSSLGVPAVEQCIVGATRRWEYPRPAGGALVTVSYPFQLVPVGN